MRTLLLCALLALAQPTAAEWMGPIRPPKLVTTSWYSRQDAGEWTASGRRFDDRKLTAAHRTLPFGTVLMITNPRNGRQVIVVVNDRGPYVTGRQLDLSRAAAEHIGIRRRGVARVWIQVL